MTEIIEKKKKEFKVNLENTLKAMSNVKEQIKIYNLKGEELASHASYLQGKIDVLIELEKGDEDDKKV